MGSASVLSPCAGDAVSSLKALRDAGRLAGKEDTVPLRLLYSRHNHSQITQDELSTRVQGSSSSGSTQVASPATTHTHTRTESRVCGRDMPSGCVSTSCVFMFPLILLLLFLSSSLVLREENDNVGNVQT